MIRASLVCLVMLTGCVNMQAARAFRALPAGEQAAFDACYAMVRGRSCSEGGIPGDVCMSDIGDRYSLLPSQAARRETLVSLGCPAPVVDQAMLSE